MKKNIFYILTVIIISGYYSCTDILDTTPYNALASSSMWQSEESVDQGVAGIYSALYDWAPGAYDADFDKGFGSTFGFERWGVAGQLHGAESLTSGSINPGSDYFKKTWQKLYEGVHRANDAIANIPAKSPASAEKNARLIAEAKFLRAYFYFRLNELFGRDGLGVPVYTEPVAIEDCTKGQSPEADVWALIVNDLTDAINERNLPDKDNTGRVSKGAAYALRGKAYLYQGAKYAEDGTVSKDETLLNKAVADFEEVGKCGYGLFQGGYKELFTEANEHCAEMIFSIQHTGDTDYGTISQKFVGSRFAYSGTANGWGNQTPAPAGTDLYENLDSAPFNWDDVIPGYSALTEPADRAVYFLRDTLDASGNILKQEGDGKPLDQTVRKKVRDIVNKAVNTKNDYLPYGNEARIRKVYTNRDPRLEANFITPYAGFIGGYSFAGAGNAMEVYSRWPLGSNSAAPAASQRADMATDDGSNFTYFHRKFVYEGTGLARREDGPLDEPLIRYANVLLWQAEAYVELNQLDKAKAMVKLVRDRVDMPTLDAGFANQTIARNYVRDERRREFVNEGVDFFDEMRWRTWKEMKFNRGKGSQGVWGNNFRAYTWPVDNDLYIWPVPQTEIEKNPNLQKTPGWKY
ncbi:MAG: RagB/SusD family nutrient uptake outer membrane protein [Dysgonomonas sp.]|jgi:hypothetical protein|uniref:RagB/SusD family nutrient uptake outer membrane protein n=1 Tax=unclassified Dysgonomonas TaxID=2630389 RepID=UPI0025C31D1A|nr:MULTISPECIES: RagB/SusD family nutrient uptake outer membrane protein [unclassified Dysgonomonas]MDR1715572.1 RagB/SusD family nutrient uptake outer membrane protein [Prevotella sp.]MDR2002173.1 RagB/SusD family nutrient uptake outer membrane protein [Prevotella sp.]HMM03416.1 RagB/SusD family nutrient uptake outer membrane protein [Dysgonomonas sp.]